MIKTPSECEVGERRWEQANRLIEIISNYEMGEGGWERVHTVIEGVPEC